MQQIQGIIRPGHRIASGQNPDSPYPAGSIQLQKPFFQAQGLELSDIFNGTLNIDISPKRFRLKQADYHFTKLNWIADFPAEDFSFITCNLVFNEQDYQGWIYYPHPETKIQHFHSDRLIEVLMPHVEGIQYGSKVSFSTKEHAIEYFD